MSGEISESEKERDEGVASINNEIDLLIAMRDENDLALDKVDELTLTVKRLENQLQPAAQADRVETADAITQTEGEVIVQPDDSKQESLVQLSHAPITNKLYNQQSNSERGDGKHS